MTTELSDSEMDEWTVPLRTLIKLLTEERERANAQAAALYAEIDELRRLLREAAGRDDPHERERTIAIH